MQHPLVNRRFDMVTRNITNGYGKHTLDPRHSAATFSLDHGPFVNLL